MQPQPTQHVRAWSLVRDKRLQYPVFTSGILGVALELLLFVWHPAAEDALGTIGTLFVVPYVLWVIAVQWLMWTDRRARRRVA